MVMSSIYHAFPPRVPIKYIELVLPPAKHPKNQRVNQNGEETQCCQAIEETEQAKGKFEDKATIHNPILHFTPSSPIAAPRREASPTTDNPIIHPIPSSQINAPLSYASSYPECDLYFTPSSPIPLPSKRHGLHEPDEMPMLEQNASDNSGTPPNVDYADAKDLYNVTPRVTSEALAERLVSRTNVRSYDHCRR